MRRTNISSTRITANQVLKLFLMDPLDRYDSHLYGSISLFKWPVAGFKNALNELLVNRFIIRRVNDYGWEKYFLTALGLRELLRNTTLREYLPDVP